ncbi:MAG: ATP-binding protein [Acetobacteraceae bacterium]
MVLLLATALIVYVGGILVYRLLAEEAAQRSRLVQVADRLRTSIDVLADLSADSRPAAAETLSSPGFRVTWSSMPLVADTSATEPRLESLRARFLELVPELSESDMRLRWDDHALAATHSIVLGGARLTDGSWITFSAALIPTAIPSLPSVLLAISFVFVSVIVVAIFLLYTINAPLRRLAQAADSYGRGRAVLLPERGPHEIVQVEQAFNALQRRIHRLIDDRTQALAAVSHDLRTPIARLRLRSGLIPDKTMQAESDRDLGEMEAMIDATLAYLRGDDDVEEPRLTDVASILATLVDAATDAGESVTLSGPHHAVALLRGLSIKRALANLIGNAVVYGESARIDCQQTADGIAITIDDCGPGIPEADLAAVFEPFHRLEASRSRATGGVGLGLTIARQAIERDGGSIRLVNREGGGLRAAIWLPARTDSRAPEQTGRLT